MILSNTNPRQQQAIAHVSGPCLVLAGAGSGKTNVITKKIAYLIQNKHFEPEHIAAITFTNKAAKEMQERIQLFVPGPTLKKITICTFHSLGLKIIQKEFQHLGLKSQFSILDAEETLSIIQGLMSTTDKGLLKKCQMQISGWKNLLLSPQEAGSLAQTKEEGLFAAVYQQYHRTMRAYHAIDFDDLILLPCQLLQSNEIVAASWQYKLQYILIDEYQDTSNSQYMLMKLLTQKRHCFTAVGDDDQAIYGWRGANIENIHQLSADYPSLEIIKLEQNYRSVQVILDAANAVITNNPRIFEKSLWSNLGQGQPIRFTAMENEHQESEKTALAIASEKIHTGGKWSDFAILYRSNHQARVIEQSLRDLQIPYKMSGGQSFFDKMEVRDVLAYLRLIVNPDDDTAFIRAATTPRRGIGDSTLEKIGQFSSVHQESFFSTSQNLEFLEELGSKQRQSLVDFIHLIQHFSKECGHHTSLQAATRIDLQKSLSALLDSIGYEAYLYEQFEERTANNKWLIVIDLVEWLHGKAHAQGLGLADIMQQITLINLLDQQDDDLDVVQLSTIHAAKGLEFKSVFLVGAEEGLLPHFGKEDETGDPEKMEDITTLRIQEERRLMYVAITRAKENLTISWCTKRKKAKEDVSREPSRFLKEMGLNLATSSPNETISPKERLAKMRETLAKKL